MNVNWWLFHDVMTPWYISWDFDSITCCRYKTSDAKPAKAAERMSSRVRPGWCFLLGKHPSAKFVGDFREKHQTSNISWVQRWARALLHLDPHGTILQRKTLSINMVINHNYN